MFDKIRPLYDRVLVQRLEAEERTSGGLYIPDTAKEKGQKGKVVAIGEGRLDPKEGKITPLRVKVGDVVIFGKYAGTDTGSDHLIVREDDILGVVEK